jgi:signal transduction histidine kinase/tetratricopeptide (TPR) repeat protein
MKIDISDLSKELLDEIRKIDSTKKNTQSDIIRLEGLENTKLIKTKLDSAKFFAIKASYYKNISRTNKALNYFDIALKTNQSLDTPLVAVIYNSKAKIYQSINNYEQSLYYFYKAIEWNLLSGDSLELSITYNDIGLMHYYLGYNLKALDYLKKSIEIKKTLNSESNIMVTMVNIGLILIDLEKTDEALKYLNEYMEYYLNFPERKTDLIIGYYNLGVAYFTKNDYDSSFYYFNKALSIAEEMNFSFGIAKISYALGDLYSEKGDYQNSLKFALKADSFQINSFEFWGYNNLTLALSYYKLGNPIYKKYFTQVEDSLKRQENTKLEEKYIEYKTIVLKSEKKFEEVFELQQRKFEIKQQQENNLLQLQISELKIQSEIDEQKIKILNLEHENQLNESKIQQRNKFIVLLIFFLIILFVLIFFIYHKNKKIVKLNNELTTSKNTIIKFFSIISHDLRGPIGAFKILLEELNFNYNEFSEEDKKELIFESAKEVNNIHKLLENLLTWAKTNQGEIFIDLKELNISEELDYIIDSYQYQTKNKNINLIHNYQPDIIFTTDKDIFNTIFRNIFSNAIKFTHIGKSIKIDLIKSESHLELKVEDEGIGMPEVIKNNLFKLDKKISRSGTEKEQGTGLGLIIINELVSKLNGEIIVNSQENIGTEIIIKLPTASI